MVNIGKESSAFYVEPLEDKNAPKEQPVTPAREREVETVTAEAENLLVRSV